MIKNVIFDLDNTIIMYDEKYALTYKEALRNAGYSEENYLKIYNAIEEYETTLNENNIYYNKTEMISFINNKLGTNYDVKLIDEINKVIGKYWIDDIALDEETLKYLCSKYNVYVFSNWFEEGQVERLKNIGYYKYFKNVFTSDKVGSKPYKQAYMNVLKFIDAKPEECVMIGDSKKSDIHGANKAGIKAILYDYDGKRDNNKIEGNYVVINNLNKLNEIL